MNVLRVVVAAWAVTCGSSVAVAQDTAKLAKASVEQLVKCENTYRRVHASTSGETPYVEEQSPRQKQAWIARNTVANAASNPPGGKFRQVTFLSPKDGAREPAALHAEVLACDTALGFNLGSLSSVVPPLSNADQGAKPAGPLTPLLQLAECNKVYRSLSDNYPTYFFESTRNPDLKRPTKEFQDVQKVITDKVDELGVKRNEWSAAARMDTSKGRVLMVDVIPRAKACDTYLKASIVPLLPPVWSKPKPSMNLAAADPASMQCPQVQQVADAMFAEVDYVRSEQIRRGDGLLQSSQMSSSQFEDLTRAVDFRAKTLKCTLKKDLFLIRMDGMTMFPLKPPRTAPLGTGAPPPAKMDAVVAATGKPGEYDQLTSCQRTYMVAAHGDHYLGGARRAPNLAQPVTDVVGKIYQRAMLLNPDYTTWSRAAYAQTAASQQVYTNIHDKVKACDVALGYNIRPLMPPAPKLVSKPATNLSAFTLEKVKAMECPALKTFIQVWQAEVEFVRSERIRLGDATIRSKQVTFGQISDMGHALEKRGENLKCGFGNVLPLTMAAAFDFAQKLTP